VRTEKAASLPALRLLMRNSDFRKWDDIMSVHFLAHTASVFLANSELPSFPSTRLGRLSQSFDFPIFNRGNQIQTGPFKGERVSPTR
jgi:hypothetical protein